MGEIHAKEKMLEGSRAEVKRKEEAISELRMEVKSREETITKIRGKRELACKDESQQKKYQNNKSKVTGRDTRKQDVGSIFEPHFCRFYQVRFKREEDKRGLCPFEIEDRLTRVLKEKPRAKEPPHSL